MVRRVVSQVGFSTRMSSAYVFRDAYLIWA